VALTIAGSPETDGNPSKPRIGLSREAAPLVAQAGAAVVIFIALTTPDGWMDDCRPGQPAGVRCRPEHWSFMMAHCILSGIFAVLGVILLCARSCNDKVLGTIPCLGVISVGRLLAFFLFAWWAVGAGIGTFDAPFTALQNGYFAFWSGFAFSVLGLGFSASAVSMAARGSGLLGSLAAASIVVILASIIFFNEEEAVRRRMFDDDKCTGQTAFALVTACITLIVVVAFISLSGSSHDSLGKTKMLVLLVLAGTWLGMAGVTTFDCPWRAAGNGYFAVWGGATVAGAAAYSAFLAECATSKTAASDAPASR